MRVLLLVSLLGVSLASMTACGDDSPDGTDGTGGQRTGEGGESADSGATNGGGGSEGMAETGGATAGGAPTTGTAGAGDSGGAGAPSGGTAGAPSGTTGGSEQSGGMTNQGGAGGTPLPDIALVVDTSQNRHAISPLIYGVNPTSAACSDPSARFTLCRLGGNRWSTYNWENNASNAGNLLCFQNDDALGSTSDPAAPVTSLVNEAGQDASVLLTIPILDYVAADKDGGGPAPECSGDVRNSGADYLTTRFVANHATKGTAYSTTPDTSDAFVYQDEFVDFVHGQAGSTEVLFALDNQPSLWDTTHAEIHAADPTYTEVVARNVEYATMVRATWPLAAITGYVGYGWNDFTTLQEAPDGAGKGEFVDYYLAAMREASVSAGQRLIDYLDIHWYPELYVGSERIIGSGTSPEMVALRVRAPLSLWASGYREDSWIVRDHLNDEVQLIPRLKEKIAANYAGTKLAISEWSYGGEAHISGAIAIADALGVFGREGLDLAAFQPGDGDVSFALGAFSLFRNYDGAGAGFGDTSVSANSSEIENVSVYASVDDANDKHVVIVAINRSGVARHATLTIADSTAFATAKLFALTAAGATPASMEPLAPASNNQFDLDLPAYSVFVIVPEE